MQNSCFLKKHDVINGKNKKFNCQLIEFSVQELFDVFVLFQLLKNNILTVETESFKENTKDFKILILLWHQRHRCMPEIDVSWIFLALEHRFSDSAPQI